MDPDGEECVTELGDSSLNLCSNTIDGSLDEGLKLLLSSCHLILPVLVWRHRILTECATKVSSMTWRYCRCLAPEEKCQEKIPPQAVMDLNVQNLTSSPTHSSPVNSISLSWPPFHRRVFGSMSCDLNSISHCESHGFIAFPCTPAAHP